MSYFTKHQSIIEQSIAALHKRSFYTPYPEHHKKYGDEGVKAGEQIYTGLLGKQFVALQDNNQDAKWGGDEVSPYTGEPLGISYPMRSAEEWLKRAKDVKKSWKHQSVDERVGILAEALDRIQAQYFELAYATMHTTGQSFVMAFQASGPHSSDRALEAAVLSWHEQKRFPEQAVWEKTMGQHKITVDKTYSPVPKGIGLVIGCSTFPVWNTVPGLFANLAAGNPTIVKPHPLAVLPIAIVVATLRQVLIDAGLPADIVQLAADKSDTPIAKQLAEHPEIKLIDFTGGNAFGDYIESIPAKTIFTEKAGVNSVIIDSVKSLDDVLQNIAFSISLFSGQMCTAPQNFFIPADGVREGDKTIPFDEVADRFKTAVDNIVNNPKINTGTLATIQNTHTLERVQAYKELHTQVLRHPERVENADFKKARCISPAMMIVDSSQYDTYAQELFGPLYFLVRTKDTAESTALAAKVAREKGAITCSAYTTSDETKALIQEQMEDAYTPVSFNLTGFIWVNQAAAFSDFHVSGGNPAGNATFANPEYVNKRFVWVQHRTLRS